MGTRTKRGFTLIELLITITIIGIMGGMILFALYRAQETAKAHKTRAIITKLDAVIKDKWQTYQYRRVPVYLGPDQYDDSTGNVAGQYDPADTQLTDWYGDGTYRSNGPDPRASAKIRLESIHDLMRMELPDRYSDICAVFAGGVIDSSSGAAATFQTPTPSPAMVPPSLRSTYQRKIGGNASVENQSAEMLYLIVQGTLASDDDSRDVFKPDNIGDTDNDGMPEFVDGWGRPIKFIRWPVGMISDLQIVARAVATNVNGDKITVSGTALSSTAGAYVGGAIARIEPSPPSPNETTSPKPIDGKRMARIIGFSAGTFTVAGSPSGQPFNGQPPSMGDTVVIMAPDPFDPTDAQRFWTNLYYPPDDYVPSFATYPLIYSAGPDGQFGILADIDNDMAVPYSYAAESANPFVSHTLGTSKVLFGAAAKLKVNDVFERDNAATDNIHNHLMGLR